MNLNTKYYTKTLIEKTTIHEYVENNNGSFSTNIRTSSALLDSSNILLETGHKHFPLDFPISWY